MLSRPEQTAPAESDERPFFIPSNVPSTHPTPPWCNTAYALSRRLTRASGKWPENFRKKTQGGPEFGNVEAEVLLGAVYERGWAGVPRDLNRAVTWYKKAAQQGHAAGS